MLLFATRRNKEALFYEVRKELKKDFQISK